MTTSARAPTAVQPCVLPDMSADPPEQFLAWRRPCSAIAFSVAAASEDLTVDEVVGVFGRSIATWREASCGGTGLALDVGILEESSTCTAPLYRDDGGNTNSVMFVQDWEERLYERSAFAVTTVWHRRSTGEILDVDMEINELRGPYGICPPEGCAEGRTVDLENVVTHELGHYLGLAHTTDADATMFASAAAGETLKRDLGDDDVAGICATYPPGSPAGDCDFEPRGGLVLHCDEGGCSASPGAATHRGFGAPVALAALAGAALRVRRRRRR